MSSPDRKNVSFRTLSGLTLRGWIYPASARGPGIILSPGVCPTQQKHQSVFVADLCEVQHA
jgi:hypothetical protein